MEDNTANCSVVEKAKSQCGDLVRATSTIAKSKLLASNSI